MKKGQYYKGKYRVVHKNKYEGDYNAVSYRSLWERQVFRWCDDTADVVRWSSEETVIAYRCKTDGKLHRYFVDLKIQFKNGDTYLIEIKPKKQTQEPKPRLIKSRSYITEVMTYAKNISKWEAATEFCTDRGWCFQIWTEDIIKGLGIKLLT
jgi:hypothetical protein